MAQNPQRNAALDNYVPVAERIEKFYEKYPEGRICTHIVEHDSESGFILMRAEVFRSSDDAQPTATGHAFEVRGESYVNKTSYVENAETSSVGRALALLGFEVKRGIASREEVEKAARMQAGDGAASAAAAPAASAPAPQRTAPRPPAAAPQPPPTPPAPEEDLDEEILQSALKLGYDAVKVRKWVNQKYSVTGGLDSLTDEDKREVVRIFREQAQSAPAKTRQR